MRCVTPKEAEEIFGQLGFSINANLGLSRFALVAENEIASRQARVGMQPTPHVNRLAQFGEALNRWHPPVAGRLLWLSHWNNDYPSMYDALLALRVGLGELRPLIEAPGFYFDPHPYNERDQTKLSYEHTRETGILVALLSLIMIGSWDAWLISRAGVDRIEFWEGNVLFYSSDKGRLSEASAIGQQFNCPSGLI